MSMERIRVCDMCSPHNKSVFCLNEFESGRRIYDLEKSIEGEEVNQDIEDCPTRLLLEIQDRRSK
jgi:hypothetical protein